MNAPEGDRLGSAGPGTVCVTGGSGTIASHLISQLLAQGWAVRTTVRRPAQEAALRATLRAQGVADDGRLHCHVADLTADAGWPDAMAGCSHVAHVASPVPAGVPHHADELIVPARDGTLRVLRAARAAGVQRVVMTSSVAAIAYGRGRGTHHFTEADWTDPTRPGLTPYVLSKTLAERAARDWVAREGDGMVFCSICPSVVLGPVWTADHSASMTVISRLLDGSLRACPNFGFGIVDVRDVADLHVRALQAPGMAGERFIASGPFMTLRQVADVLRRELGPQARQVTARDAPDWLVHVLALFNPMARAILPELGSVRHQDASHARAVLGWQPRPAEQSIVETARSLLALGLVRV